MGNARLRAYCDDLTRVSKITTGAADEIDGLRAKLGSQMDHLRRTWTGQAASAYLTVWADINDECGDMLADLRWIGESLDAVAAAYQHNEHACADELRSVRPPSDRL